MPYIIDVSVNDGSSTRQEFEPLIDGKLKARIALGYAISEVERSQIPSTLVVTPKAHWKQLPDVFGWNNSPFIISPRLREMIEGLEPDVHTFHSIDIRTDKKWKDLVQHGAYFLLLNIPKLDAIVPEKTAFSKGIGVDAMKTSVGVAGINLAPPPCTLRKKVIEGHHLWQLPDGWSPKFFCSDELWHHYQEANMLGWETYHNCAVV